MDCHNNDNTSGGRYGSSVCGVCRSDCVWRHVGDNDDERVERATSEGRDEEPIRDEERA